MPPIRRYLRITPHSLLECRIFLDSPADTNRWLLSATDPALPRIFEAVRPLILPKLREENEKTRNVKAAGKGKGGKKGRAVKDVVKGSDFEVVVFLTEGGSGGRHEVVIKVKEAKEKEEIGRGKRSATGGHRKEEPVVIREEDNDDEDGRIRLQDIPSEEENSDGDSASVHARKRRKIAAGRDNDTETDEDEAVQAPFQDDKKKLGFKTTYDGFSIWGKVLFLLVTRKGVPGAGRKRNLDVAPAAVSSGTNQDIMTALARSVSLPSSENAGGQALMQEWISSTQIPQDDEDEEN